jgi:pimeloyl-ACP methyl ester carboxylesterase
MNRPETRYARSGDVNIAYQVVGNGPRDLVFVPGWISNIDVSWEEPSMARFLRRLASFTRLIVFDKRGTGLSDRVADMPTLETRMDDVRAVLDAVGSARTALCGYSEGGPMCALFSATYPHRTSALITIGSFPRRTSAEDFPWGPSHEQRVATIERRASEWGNPIDLEVWAPSVAKDSQFREWWARFLRSSASPAGAVALSRMNLQIDVRDVLPLIRVPTLILHNAGDRAIQVECSRYMAQRIPGAKYVELQGQDHLPFVGNSDEILDEVEEFLTGVRHAPDPDRILATVMFVDIVNSTGLAAHFGDRRWRDVLAGFYELVRQQLASYRGGEIDTAGDGFLAAFDGPARAVRAASAITTAVRRLGIEVRAGVHTGECERMGSKFSGIAVHIGARIASMAAPGEVLVSSTVKDLVAGSGITFVDRGVQSLKGVPGEWRLYELASAQSHRH